MHDGDKKRATELYKICVEEEHYFLAEHQKRIAFYIGLLSAVLTLTIGGLLKATAWYHFAILVLGGLLLVAVSSIAKAGTRRIYQRFLETVTTRAKLEQDLGFSQERSQGEGGWVMTEPFSPVRHSKSRTEKKWKTSKEWVDSHLNKKDNYHGVSRRLFSTVFWIGIALIVVAIAFACVKGCGSERNPNANNLLQRSAKSSAR